MNLQRSHLFTATALVVVTILAIVTLWPADGRRLRSPERKQWKEQSLAALRVQWNDSASLSNELARVRAISRANSEHGWVGTNLLLMANGEWLAYRNRCWKEPGNLHDIFLARGSDGKWYYSTFHFCVGMIVLRGGFEDAGSHESLADFTRTFALREFDGVSDECLNETWPPKR